MSGGRAGHAHRRWRISGKKAHIDTVRNDINVTPLVDVMLVLLIIFMLMTLVMGRGKDVVLVKAKNVSAEKDKSQPVVTVDLEGNLWVEKDKVGLANDQGALKEMQSRVEAAWAAPKNPEGVGRVYFKAPDNVEYSKVYPVLEYMNKTMQMQTVDLAVAEEKEN